MIRCGFISTSLQRPTSRALRPTACDDATAIQKPHDQRLAVMATVLLILTEHRVSETRQLPDGVWAKAVLQLFQDFRNGHSEIDHFITGQKVRGGLCVWHRLFMPTLVGPYRPVMCRGHAQNVPVEILGRFGETCAARYAGR